MGVGWGWGKGPRALPIRYINRYTQYTWAKLAFSNHLGTIPSGNPLNLATSIELSDLDPCDRGWSQNPMQCDLACRQINDFYLSGLLMFDNWCPLVEISIYQNGFIGNWNFYELSVATFRIEIYLIFFCLFPDFDWDTWPKNGWAPPEEAAGLWESCSEWSSKRSWNKRRHWRPLVCQVKKPFKISIFPN